MKFIKNFINFLSEKAEKDFDDKIKDHGYFKGISTSTARKKIAQMKDQSNKADDDPTAYDELPGDTKGKKLLKKSKHTDAYHDLYDDDKNESIFNWDNFTALYEDSVDINEDSSGDRSPLDNPDVETGLKKKSEETGVPLPLLRIVMRRGLAAWKSGHRPGAGQEQWGYARVNSFLTKAPGTWGRPIKDPQKNGPKGAYGADADVAQEVIKGGHDKNLK
jgi:hypothetical protein